MGTRAVLTFKDKYDSFSVYHHYDGYPEHILPSIKDAQEFAWDLPRFEASDFGAAFIAANKQKGGGNIYMTDSYESHGDLEYRYEIEGKDGKLLVKVYKVEEYDEDSRQPIYSPIEEVTL
jgi:hypothetical protein